MTASGRRSYRLPVEQELGLHRLTNAAGIEIGILPNGCIFAIEHVQGDEHVLINQVFGSPLGNGIGRVLLRGGTDRTPVELVGPNARVQVGVAADRVVWDGTTNDIGHRVTLWLHPDEPVWLWHVELTNKAGSPVECDAVLLQDLGLGARGLLLSNEAYASQYIDHTIGDHARFGPVIMSRQNMDQFGRHPWAAHGCLDGAARFATDALQLFGPAFRCGKDVPGLQGDLPSEKLQHETACAALQSKTVSLGAGESASLTFFAQFEPHHTDATGEADLARIATVDRATTDFQSTNIPLSSPSCNVLQNALPFAGIPLADDAVAEAFPERMHEERVDGTLLSFFVADGSQNRHVVLAAKEHRMRRRHGAIMRSGDAILPDESALSATCWMHGVFATQLTIGNTALHKLFSVSRDPYNVTRASGLRILVDRGEGWRLLTVPSLFEIGLNDCRWLYRDDDGSIDIRAIVPAGDTAMQWGIMASGKPARFMICAHLVMGEHEFRHAGQVEIDAEARRISMHPDPDWLWGQTYPDAIHHLVTSTPDVVDAMGSGALLFEAEAPRAADGHIAILTKPTDAFAFAVVGSLTDPHHAEQLAAKYEGGIDTQQAYNTANAYWRRITQDIRFGGDPELDTIFPWFVHDAMIHLSAPRGLEQYTAAAWGTRDVCQGPVELLLPLGHFEPVKDILRILFAQQYQASGDWPQWFMLAPYGQIRDRHSHGDVIVWPLKALCDYLEATKDFGFLNEPIAWTADDFTQTLVEDPLINHVERLLVTVGERFIPGTHLIRYGLGDWNDSLQPADPTMRDWMVSSWTVALLYQQLTRYAQLLRDAGRPSQADEIADHAIRMRGDFNRYLMPDGTVAGYALFKPEGGEPDYLLHPRDARTGVHHSLIPMTRSIIAGLFTPEQVEHHLRLIREHLLFPDGVRLMDRPVAYRGGVEVNFRRAESAAFFGREIGLMYSHAHLRYCEALGVLGAQEELREALRLVDPIGVKAAVPHASLRQRNAYFSSSDAAFRDRYEASEEWARVNNGTVDVDGGWRVYSSGPGIFVRLALQYLQKGS